MKYDLYLFLTGFVLVDLLFSIFAFLNSESRFKWASLWFLISGSGFHRWPQMCWLRGGRILHLQTTVRCGRTIGVWCTTPSRCSARDLANYRPSVNQTSIKAWIFILFKTKSVSDCFQIVIKVNEWNHDRGTWDGHMFTLTTKL